MILEKNHFKFENETISLFDFIQTKNFRSQKGKTYNALIGFVFKSGLISLYTIDGDEFKSYQSNLTDVIDISFPFS